MKGTSDPLPGAPKTSLVAGGELVRIAVPRVDHVHWPGELATPRHPRPGIPRESPAMGKKTSKNERGRGYFWRAVFGGGLHLSRSRSPAAVEVVFEAETFRNRGLCLLDTHGLFNIAPQLPKAFCTLLRVFMSQPLLEKVRQAEELHLVRFGHPLQDFAINESFSLDSEGERKYIHLRPGWAGLCQI